MTNTYPAAEAKASRYIWSVLAMIVFVAINYAAIYYLQNKLRMAINGMTWLKFIILAAGVFRITDIITHEKVAAPLRAIFRTTDSDGVSHTATRGFRGFLGQLFDCNSCLGVWIAMIVVYLYVWFPLETFIVMIIMALTGFERMFSKIYNALEKRG